MANGLINLQTDLKSLRYGSDKPYVTKDIGDSPGSQIGIELSHRLDDTSRIAQMFISKPGINYLLHEAELQQIGVGQRIRKAQQGGKSLVGAVLGQIGNTLVTTAKIVGSTLSQVPVNGTGTHFLKAFRTDTYLQPTNGNQASGFAKFFGAGGVEGAPLALQGKPIEGEAESNFGTKVSPTEYKVTRNSSFDYDEYLNTPIPKDSEGHKALAEAGKPITIPGPQYETTATAGYLGSIPNTATGSISTPSGSEFKLKNDFTEESKYRSKIALNKSTTKLDVKGTPVELSKVVPTLGDNGNNTSQKYTPEGTYTGNSTEKVIGNVLGGKKVYTKEITGSFRPTGFAQDYQPSYQPFADPVAISEVSEKDVTTGPSTEIVDFRLGSLSSYSYDYNSKTVNREQRVGLGNQGKSKNRVNYMAVDPASVDRINALDISNTRIDGTKEARDFAKFYFEIITPEGSKFLHFRAFIDSIDDGYNANWEAHKYVGRAENFYTYGGFDRDISISFKIAAASRSEMKPLYKKMVYLASATAPTYGTSGLMRGTLARLTVGSYLAQIPGVITSVKFTLDNNTPWEIAMGNPDGGDSTNIDDDVQELPMMLNCSVSFKPIHDFAPQTGLHHYFTSPTSANGSTPFFKDGEGDFQKAPITSTLADKAAVDTAALANAKAQQAAADAAAKTKAYNSDQARVKRIVGPVDAHKVSKKGLLLGRETGGGI